MNRFFLYDHQFFFHRQYNNRFFREYVKMLNVRVGSTNATSGGELMRVTEISFHPNYKPTTLEFNAAILKLYRNLTTQVCFLSCVSAGCVPDGQYIQ